MREDPVETGRSPAVDSTRPSSVTGGVPSGVPRAAESRRPSVALVSPCGWGNLGDAAIQEAVIQNLREAVPDIGIIAFTLNPADTRERHGIPAYPLAREGNVGHLVRWDEDDHEEGAFLAWADRMSDSLYDVRYLGRLWATGLRAIRGVRDELRHTMMAYRRLRDVDLLVVSGGGQIDDYWGGAWGHPWSMLKLALLGRLARTDFVVIGVGVGTARSRTSRFLLRATLRTASYRSFRDAESVAMVEELGLEDGNALSADLAFALDPDRAGVGRESGVLGTERRVVGVSPIAYLDPRTWPEKDEAAYRDYVERLGDFCRRLLADGQREIVLFSTDGCDARAVDDLRDLMVERGWADGDESLRVERVDRIDQLFRALARTEMVVASRLHGVLLSHLAGRPVVALSYDRKVDRHMESLGQEAFTLSIDTFEPEECWATFRELEAEADRARSAIRRNVRQHARRARRDIGRALSMLPTAGGAP